MELALYTPEYGYYTGGSHKIGTDGDFITAPTLTPDRVLLLPDGDEDLWGPEYLELVALA